MSRPATDRPFVCDAGLHPRAEAPFPSREPCGRCASEAALAALGAVLVERLPEAELATLVAVTAAAAKSGVDRRRLHEHLLAEPDALVSGDAGAPAVLVRLLHGLADAGVAGVVRVGCADCGRANRRFGVADGKRVCIPCYRRRHPEICSRCGQPAVVAARVDGEPVGTCCHRARASRSFRYGIASGTYTSGTRAFLCAAGKHPRYRPPFPSAKPCALCAADAAVAQLVELLATILPAAPAKELAAVVEQVAPSGTKAQRLLAHLRDVPDALVSGRSDAPPTVIHLAHALAAAGTAGVVAPRCADCDRVAALDHVVDGGRICSTCAHRRTAQPCSRCGKTATVSARIDGQPIGRCCYVRPEISCSVCGSAKGMAGTQLRRPLCGCCAEGPLAICAHCGLDAPPPEGPEEPPCCKRCRASATLFCVDCGQPTVVVRGDGRARCHDCQARPTRRCGACGQHAPIARRAIGELPDLCNTCHRFPVAPCCGCNETKPSWAAGRCATCALAEKLTALLGDLPSRQSRGLDGLYHALATAAAPSAVLGWLRRSDAARILADMASGTAPLDLATLDGLAYTGSRRFLERLLIASGAVAPRDSRLAWLETWTEQLVSATEPDEHLRALRGYARWVVLRRLRDLPGAQPTSQNRADGARRRLKIAHDFLGYLAVDGVDLAGCDQTHVDCWLDNRSAPADELRPFLAWLRAQRMTGPLHVPPHASSVPRPVATETTLARRILHAPGLAVSDRMAAALVVLFAQPLVRITRLRVDDVLVAGGSVRLRLGHSPVEVPSPLDQHLRALLDERRPRVAAGVPDSGWLFPGGAPGQPIHESVLSKRLQRIGVQPGNDRHGALVQLCAQLPAAVVSDLLGVSVQTAERWAAIAGRPWADYVAARLDNNDTQ